MRYFLEKLKQIIFYVKKQLLELNCSFWSILQNLIYINPLTARAHQKAKQLKQICSFQMEVCLSMCDLIVDTRS